MRNNRNAGFIEAEVWCFQLLSWILHLALNGLNDSKSIGTSLPISSRLSQLTPATTAHFLTAEDEKEQELEQEGGGGGDY